MALSPIINSFNGGEYSPKLDCRSDLEKYYSGCQQLENMYCEAYGDASNQPGTYFVNEVKDSSKKTILIPFKHSIGQAYQLEFGEGYIRFYMNGAQIVYTTLTIDSQPADGDWSIGDILTGGTSEVTCEVVAVVSSTVYTVKHVTGTWTDGETITAQDDNARDCGEGYPEVADSATPCEVTSPYTEEDLYGIYYKQSADVMILTHIEHTYPAYKLSRLAHDDWEMEEIDFEYGPFLKENATETTITAPTPPTDVTSGETFSASNIYDELHNADKAFDDIVVGESGWSTEEGESSSQWLKIDFGAGDEKTIKRIRMQPTQDMLVPKRCPRHWKLEASDTGAFGGEEVKIPASKWSAFCEAYNTDEVESEQIANYVDWIDVTFTNTTAYRYYRFWFYDSWGWNSICVKEIEMFETTGDVYTASSEIFTANHVGSLWQLIYNMDEEYISGSLDAADEVSGNLPVFATWNFTTEGDWIGKVQIQRSYDNGTTWHPYHTYTRATAAGLNYQVTGNEETEDVLYRVYMTARTSGTCHYCLSIDDSSVKGIIRITEFVSTHEVGATVVKALASGVAGVETKRWAEGAWSAERGYPGTVEFFEERTVFGGNIHKPHSLWFSKSHDWFNMRAGVLSDSALIYDLPTAETIKWLACHERLLIGTKADEWRLGSADPNQPLTPEQPSAARRQTGYGSADLQPILVGNLIIFMQRMSKTVMGLQYFYEKGEAGGYDAQDLTLLAEHITGPGIIQITLQNQPESVLWGLTSDGDIIGMTCQFKETVAGWHRHTTDGLYESISAIPTASGEDELWVIVNRTIGGQTKRYIEYFMPRDWGTDQKDCFFVHSGLTFDGGAASEITDISVGGSPYKVTVTAVAHGLSNGQQVKKVGVGGMTEVNNTVFTVSDKATDTFILKDKTNSVYISGEDFSAYTSGGTVQQVDNSFSGLGHLKGETVAVLADGAVHKEVVVSGSGQITLDIYANKVHAGLPYTAKLMPMKIAFPTGKGSTRGDKKRIHEIVFSFYKTLGAKFGTTEGAEQINFREVADAMGEAIPLFTGMKAQTFSGGYDLDGDIYIEQDQPLPLTVRAIIPKLEIYGD